MCVSEVVPDHAPRTLGEARPIRLPAVHDLKENRCHGGTEAPAISHAATAVVALGRDSGNAPFF